MHARHGARTMHLPPAFVAAVLCVGAWRSYIWQEEWICVLTVLASALCHVWLTVSRNPAWLRPWANLSVVLMASITTWSYAIKDHLKISYSSNMVKRTNDPLSGYVLAGVAALVAIFSEGHAQSLFPWWPVRVLIALQYTVGRLAIILPRQYSSNTQPFRLWDHWALILAHSLTGVVLPLLFYPCPRRPQAPAACDTPEAGLAGTARLSARAGGALRQGGPPAALAQARCPDSSMDDEESECGQWASHGSAQHLPCRTRASWWGGPPAITAGLSAYQSVLGPRFNLNIKIATRHEPEHLHPNTLNNLAVLVNRHHLYTEGYAGSVALGAAVRRGCIMLSCDLSLLLPAGIATGASSGTSTRAVLTAEQVLAYAQRVLPSLLTDLGLGQCSDDSGKGHVSGEIMTAPTPLLEPGQYLQLHLGGHVVQASMDRHTQAWVFEVEATQCGSTSTKLCLAQPHPAAAAATDSTPAGVHTVHFGVQVRQQQPSDYLFVRGSDPAADPAHDSDKPGLQLWVHCQGQYLRTVVEEVNSYTGRVEAVVQVPASALVCHHQPGGPTARVQLLTAELWQGPATVLSSTPLLLDTAQHMQPAVQTTFGWWGASSTAVAGLVSEVSALTAHVLDMPTDAAVHSHQAFVSDLATWLSTVQHSAPGTCCDMCEPASPGRVTLTPNQCTALADSLRQHARLCNLGHTAVTVTAQRLRITTTTTATSTLSCALHRAALSTGLLRRCTQCDQVYYTKLRDHFSNARLWISIFSALLHGVAALQATPAHLGMWFTAAVVLICTLTFSSHFSAAAASPPKALFPLLSDWLLHRAGLELLCWSGHITLEVAALTGLLPISSSVCRPSTAAPYILTESFFVLMPQQIWVWGRAPTWLLRVMMVLEAVAHSHATSSCPSIPALLTRYYFIPAAIVIPWLMDGYWRRLLRVHGPRAHGVPAACTNGE